MMNFDEWVFRVKLLSDKMPSFLHCCNTWEMIHACSRCVLDDSVPVGTTLSF